MGTKKIITFLAITFGITWISWWLLAFIKQDNSQIFSNPLFFVLFVIGGIAPTIVAYLSIRFTDKEFSRFNRSVLKWRVNLLFYLFSIIVIIGVRYISIAIYGLVYRSIWEDLSPQFIALIPLFIIMIPLGGLEEFGWRGLLLPELAKKINFQVSSLLVGVIWALWHLPMFFINGLSHYQSDFFQFAIQTIGLGFVLAWLYKRTNSVFICVFFHAFYNASSSMGLNCPGDGDFITSLVWLIIGLSFIVIDRKKLK